MAQRLIISNTTPLINFAETGRMEILEKLFGTLIIPPAVRDELQAKSNLFPAAARVPAMPFVRIKAPPSPGFSTGLTSLHAGETACLALAADHPGSLLLLDELAAREWAVTQGHHVTGTLGCLAEAKRRGLLPAIGPVIQELRSHARFWISDKLAARLLRDAGE